MTQSNTEFLVRVVMGCKPRYRVSTQNDFFWGIWKRGLEFKQGSKVPIADGQGYWCECRIVLEKQSFGSSKRRSAILTVGI